MADDKKAIDPDVGTSTEATEQASSAPDLADTTAPAPLGSEALTVEEQLILEHEGQAALFEMGEVIPDVSEFPNVTIPEQPEPDKDDKQVASHSKDDPAPTGKVVDFVAAREEAGKAKSPAKEATPPNKEGKKWGCSNRISNGRAVCNSHHVNEETLQRTYTTAIRNMLGDVDSLMEAVRDSAREAMQPDNRLALRQAEQEIARIQEQVLALHKLKQQCGVSAADYAAQVKDYSEKLQALERKQAELQTTENKYSSVKLSLESIAEHIKSGEVMNADDSRVMKQLVQQIIVGDEGIEIKLQCSVSIKQEYV